MAQAAFTISSKRWARFEAAAVAPARELLSVIVTTPIMDRSSARVKGPPAAGHLPDPAGPGWRVVAAAAADASQQHTLNLKTVVVYL